MAFALDDVPDESDVDFTKSPLREFLNGYRGERTVDEAALAQIETFRRAGDLVRYAKIRRSLDLPDASDYPD